MKISIRILLVLLVGCSTPDLGLRGKFLVNLQECGLLDCSLKKHNMALGSKLKASVSNLDGSYAGPDVGLRSQTQALSVTPLTGPGPWELEAAPSDPVSEGEAILLVLDHDRISDSLVFRLAPVTEIGFAVAFSDDYHAAQRDSNVEMWTVQAGTPVNLHVVAFGDLGRAGDDLLIGRLHYMRMNPTPLPGETSDPSATDGILQFTPLPGDYEVTYMLEGPNILFVARLHAK